MAAPGTQELVRWDASNHLRIEEYNITTQPAGVHITSGLGQVLFTSASINTFVAAAEQVYVVIDTDKHGVTVYATTDAPLAVSVQLRGDP